MLVMMMLMMWIWVIVCHLDGFFSFSVHWNQQLCLEVLSRMQLMHFDVCGYVFASSSFCVLSKSIILCMLKF
jgi:hypothetical protein